MCGGSPSVDNSGSEFARQEAVRARQEQEALDRRITNGMAKIGAIFDGGSTGPMLTNSTVYDPNRQYETADGKAWKPKATQYDANGEIIKGTGATAQLRDMLGKLYLTGSGKTYAGMQPILDARRKAQEDFYLPQLDKEYSNGQDDLTFALSRAGLLSSTAATKKIADLDEGFNLEKAGQMAKIDADIASTKSGMNQQRSTLEAQLRASGDASAATNAALASRGAFAQDEPELNPLGHIFASFAQNIGQINNGYGVGQIRQAARGSGGSVNRDLSKIVG